MKEVFFTGSLSLIEGDDAERDFKCDNSPIKMIITNEDTDKPRFFFTVHTKRVPAAKGKTLDLRKKLILTWKDGNGSMSTDGLRVHNLSKADFERLKANFRLSSNADGRFIVEGLIESPSSHSRQSTHQPQQKSAAPTARNASGSASTNNNDWAQDDHTFSGTTPLPPHSRQPPKQSPSLQNGTGILRILTHASQTSNKTITAGHSASGVNSAKENATKGFAPATARSDLKQQPPVSENVRAMLDASNKAKTVARGNQPSKTGSSGLAKSAPPTGKVNFLPISQTGAILNRGTTTKRPDILKTSSAETYKRSGTTSFFPKSSSSSSGLSSTSLSTFSSSNHAGNRFEGMRNLGNTCYMGAVAQALLALPGLVNDLLSPFWEVGARESASIVKDAEKRRKAPTCLNELAQLVRTRKLKSSPIRVPSDLSQLKRAVESHSSQFSGFSQQDAHEFLCTLMDAVHDEGAAYLKTMSASIPATTASPTTNSSFNSDRTSVESTDDDEVIQVFPEGASGGQHMQVDAEREEQGGEEEISIAAKRQRVGDEGQDVCTAIVTPLTPGDPITASSCPATTPGPSTSHQLSSLLPTLRNMHAAVKVTLTCLSCNTLSDPRTDLYRDFSLDLDRSEYSAAAFKEKHKLNSPADKSGGIPLEILLENFFAPEERSLSCSRCENAGAMACARSSLTVLPGVLVLHLKRFRYDPRTSSFTKMLTPVQFGRHLMLPAAAVDPECEKPDNSGSNKLRKVPTDLMSQWHVPSSASPMSNLATGPQRYSLSAVVRHFGATASSGHYMCDIKGQGPDGSAKWTRCDDSSEFPVKEEEVFGDKTTPYILFFSLNP